MSESLRKVDAIDERNYKDLTNSIHSAITKMQSCTDVDEAVQLFEHATHCIEVCEQKLSNAQGRFQKIVQSIDSRGTPTN